MKVIYKKDYEQFLGGVIKPRERMEVETTVEEAAELGENWIKLLKIVQDIRSKGRVE